jgi:hypothetical protein
LDTSAIKIYTSYDIASSFVENSDIETIASFLNDFSSTQFKQSLNLNSLNDIKNFISVLKNSNEINTIIDSVKIILMSFSDEDYIFFAQTFFDSDFDFKSVNEIFGF